MHAILTPNVDLQKRRKDLQGCVMFARASIKGLKFSFVEADS